MQKVIFFGNGPLADYTLETLKDHAEIIFHAKTKEDLETVKDLKAKNPEAHGILASFGVMIKSDVLDLFEPEGILNIHPSLLPAYRGASPIESAILNGDTDFSVSIMKLVKAMDAGPIYHQETIKALPLCKNEIYKALATAGAKWLVEHLDNLPEPQQQDGSKATFTVKFDKSLSMLKPEEYTADELHRQIVAFLGYPKSKYDFYNKECIILEAEVSDMKTPLSIKCKDGKFLSIQKIQPAGKKPMDAKSFLNGYAK
jgi:methionyl-tRNA formyltransferase